MANDIRFNPIRGKETIISQQAVMDGNIYFATDTGKIFVDAQGKRNIMGGSGTSVLYTQAESIYAHPNGTYIINSTALIDKNYLPRKDDLIINTDGRFLKVISANDTQIVCNLIAVSGTGTGGPSTPGGPDDSGKYIDVFYPDGVPLTFVDGTDYIIKLTATSQVDLNLNVAYRVEAENLGIVETDAYTINNGDTVSLNVGKKMTINGANAVTITITGVNSITYEYTITNIRKVKFSITQLASFINSQIFTDSFNYPVKIEGAIDKTLKLQIDNAQPTIESLGTKEYSTKYLSIDCTELNAGVHSLKVWLDYKGLASEPISTQFIYHPIGTEPATYVMIINSPEECYSYENPKISYWVYDMTKSEKDKNIIKYALNHESQSNTYEAEQEKGKPLEWEVTGLVSGEVNTCTIECNGVSQSCTIKCIASNKFEPLTQNMLLALSPEGKTNNTSAEYRKLWQYNNIKANLKNFNWKTNGWMQDDNKRTCLRISNGASVEIPINIFESAQPTQDAGYTIEFEFKPYNLYSYQLLNDSTTTIENEENEEDVEVTIERTFNADLASIKYTAKATDNSDFGFCCGTQDAFFRMHNGDHVTARYTNDEIINISFVVDIFNRQLQIYLNGILSSMSTYTSNSELAAAANTLIINSDYCDIDLYGIRIYNIPFTFEDIAQNYLASKKDLALAEQNSFGSGTTVSLSELEAYNDNNPDNTTIPYIIFETTAEPNVLPFNKNNADVTCNIEFVHPALDVLLNRGKISEDDYKNNAPSFKATGVSLNVQGTSSQIYPRKNFKGKFKTVTSWQCSNENIKEKTLTQFTMMPGISEKTFTWKADYMDSSSCHNTGFMDYVHNLYWNHPLDYYANTNVACGINTTKGKYHSKYRTTLFGFPVLAFHKTKTSTEFIGIYNFNLDKSAPSVLGMNVSVEETDTNYKNLCECWEFANNKNERCSFRPPAFNEGYVYDENGKVVSGMTTLGNDLEPRYHYNKEAIEGAWKNLNKPLEDGGTPITPQEAHEVILGEDGESGAYEHLRKLFNWVQDSYFAFDLSDDRDKTWAEELINHEIEVDNDYKTTDTDFANLVAVRKAKFINEFDKHFNKEYTLIYYILTELFLMYDSRGKNMMLASWGPMENNGDYIWFPIFYDSDTQLGVNNSGVPSWGYNVEPSTGFNNNNNKKAFSTNDSLLWRGVHQYFTVETQAVQNMYQNLINIGTLSAGKAQQFYNFNLTDIKCMQGILPLTVFNANEYYKYIAPSINGYVNGLNSETNEPIYRTTNRYFYCLQGTRALYRSQLLRNRFNYYNSKWMAGDYIVGSHADRVAQWRANGRDEENNLLDSNFTLNIKPTLDTYVNVWFDQDTDNIYPYFTKGGEITPINLNGKKSSSQQIINIPGYHYLQEIGNVSLLYPNQIAYGDNTVKIELGNTNPYYTPQGDLPQDQVKGTVGPGNEKPLLKVFDITNNKNISGGFTLSSLDLTGSPKLEEFKACGTDITDVTFDRGVNLKKLYLPKTIQSLSLSEAMNLTSIVYDENDIYTTAIDDDGSEKIVETENGKGIYIEDFYDNDTITTNINQVDIEGGNLRLASYDFINKLTEARENKTLKLSLKNVQWSPYSLIEEGAVYDNENANKIKYANNNFTFSDYTYSADTWEKLLTEKRLYLYDSTLLPATPTSLNLLDDYIENDNYTDLSGTGTKKPIITGEMFINNTDLISEYDIAKKYNVAFPDLTIRVANVAEAYRVRFEDKNGQEIFTHRYPTFESVIEAPDRTTIPIPQHYDFVDWYVKDDEDKRYTDDFSTLQFIEGEHEIILVLNTQIHKYNIIFVNGDGSTTKTKEIEYNTIIEVPSDFIPYKSDDANLAYNEVYAFKGWSNNEKYAGGNNIITNESAVVDLNNIKATKDMTFYSVYMKDDVHNNILSSNLFNITKLNKYTDGQDDTYNINKACAQITLDYSKYGQTLKGKITIPDQVPDPENSTSMLDVVAVGGFNNTSITHCFFKNPKSNHIRTIMEKGFRNCKQLKYIELPAGLRKIELEAFFSCPILIVANDTNFYDIRIENVIYYIGSRAFCLGGEQKNMGTTNIYIGPSVTSIGDQAFAFIDERLPGTITIGTSIMSTRLSKIGTNIFRTNYGRMYSSATVYCEDAIHHDTIETLLEEKNALTNITTITYKWSEGEDTDPPDD